MQSSALMGSKKEMLFQDAQWNLQASVQTWYLETYEKNIQDLHFPAYDKTKVRFFKEGKGLALAYVNDTRPAPLKKELFRPRWKCSQL